MAALTSEQPGGPYSSPTLLIYPQSDVFHPPLLEFYPAFVHEGHVYAPATSVAANRNYQTLFRALLEEAHLPRAWQIYQHGSVWHDMPVPHEKKGIWGQTFSGQVGPDNILRVMFPSKNAEDIGTINLAHRPWDRPYKDGFVLSAPNKPSVAILRQCYRDFQVQALVRANGGWSFAFACRNPLGPDRVHADACLDPVMRTQRMELKFQEKDWSLCDGLGVLKQGALPPGGSPVMRLEIKREGRQVRALFNGALLFSETVPDRAGRLELLAEAGTILFADEFHVAGEVLETSEFWLATEARAGCADITNDWRPVTDTGFRYGAGYFSKVAGARAKWNYEGRGFRIWAPVGPEYGTAQLKVDAGAPVELSFRADKGRKSGVVLSCELPAGYHSVIITVSTGEVPLDVLEVFP
jgi:hypothetical protein